MALASTPTSPPLLDDVHRLDLAEGRWQVVEPNGAPPPARCSHASVIIGGEMYVFGGEGAQQSIIEEDEEDTEDEEEEAGEEEGEEAGEEEGEEAGEEGEEGEPDSPSEFQMAPTTPRFRMLSDLHVLTLEPGAPWRPLYTAGEGPCARSGAASAAVGGRMYVFGGWDENKRELSDLWEFRVRTTTWTRLPTAAELSPTAALAPAGFVGGAPCARTGAVLLAQPHSDRLLLFGGCDAHQQFSDLFEYRLAHRHHHSDRRGGSRHRRNNTEDDDAPSSSRSSRRDGGSSHREATGGSGVSPRPVGWSRVEMSGVPPPRRSNHMMVHHEGRALIFGGFDGQGFLGDLSAAVLDK